jgi:hypothetical protein
MSDHFKMADAVELYLRPDLYRLTPEEEEVEALFAKIDYGEP